jgi:hypothetical protein
MKSRGCSLLLFLLTLAGHANTVSAQSPALRVQVYDYAGLSPAALHEFIARTQKIVAATGVSLEMETCAIVAPTCETRIGTSKRLVIRVVADSGNDWKNLYSETLGMSVAGPDGGTYATVFLKPTEEKAADVKLSQSVVLAYAAAHEIGHLLLGDRAHTPHGLMKAIWDTNDFQAMTQNNLHFSPEQSRELKTRYGTARRIETAADISAVRP